MPEPLRVALALLLCHGNPMHREPDATTPPTRMGPSAAGWLPDPTLEPPWRKEGSLLTSGVFPYILSFCKKPNITSWRAVCLTDCREVGGYSREAISFPRAGGRLRDVPGALRSSGVADIVGGGLSNTSLAGSFRHHSWHQRERASSAIRSNRCRLPKPRDEPDSADIELRHPGWPRAGTSGRCRPVAAIYVYWFPVRALAHVQLRGRFGQLP